MVEYSYSQPDTEEGIADKAESIAAVFGVVRPIGRCGGCHMTLFRGDPMCEQHMRFPECKLMLVKMGDIQEFHCDECVEYLCDSCFSLARHFEFCNHRVCLRCYQATAQNRKVLASVCLHCVSLHKSDSDVFPPPAIQLKRA